MDNNNYLFNADGGPGQVGSKLSVPNANLPGDNELWDTDENLAQDFRVGLLQNKRFTLVLDLYASTATTAAAGQASAPEVDEFLGRLTLELDPEAPVAPSYTLYLPVANK